VFESFVRDIAAEVLAGRILLLHELQGEREADG
jgi:hypothetical protein